MCISSFRAKTTCSFIQIWVSSTPFISSSASLNELSTKLINYSKKPKKQISWQLPWNPEFPKWSLLETKQPYLCGEMLLQLCLKRQRTLFKHAILIDRSAEGNVHWVSYWCIHGTLTWCKNPYYPCLVVLWASCMPHVSQQTLYSAVHIGRMW